MRITASSTLSDDNRATGCIGRAFFGAFGLIFVGAGLAFCGLSLRTAWQEARERSWPAVSCTLVASSVDDNGKSDHRYTWKVQYAYTYDGIHYTSDRYARDYTGSSNYGNAQQLQFAYPVNSQATCYVNPQQPSDAVLRHRGFGYLLGIPFGLVFAAFGLLPLAAAARAGQGGSAAAVRVAGPISNQAARGAKGPVVLCAIFVLVGGLVLWAAFLRPLLKSQEALKSWRQVPCTIVSSRVASHSGRRSTTYSPDILYRYMIDGREYRSNRYDFFGGSSSGYEAKAQIVHRFHKGLETRCYVNPAEPTQAVLQPQDTTSMWWAAIPGVFFAGGLLGLLAVATGAVRGTAPERSTGIRRAANLSIVPRRAGVDPDRPLTLRPRVRPATMLIGIACFALFWNGILSVFVWHAYQDWRHGSWPIFGLFLIPFVLVGLGLVGATFYFLLALFNPRVSLTLSRGTIAVGEAADLQWSFSGRSDRIERLTIRLEGREEATYRRGTDTRTDTSVFATFDLLDTARDVEIRSGRKRVEIPTGAAPTFRATHNKVLWVLKVQGQIPRWPDVDEEFEIEVIPSSAAAPAPLAPGVADADAADESQLSISIDGGRTAFAPGETVRGAAFWDVEAPPRSLEVRLFWFTRGKGTTDVRLIERLAIDNPSQRGSRLFQFTLPAEPQSFSGRLVSLAWAIELVAEPGDRSQRVELIVAPGGGEIHLQNLSPSAA